MPITIDTARPKGKDAPPPRNNKWVAWLIEGTIIVLAILFGLALRGGLYETAIVTSGSMEPTLRKDDRLLVDHRRSLHGQWQRGDCILFSTPQAWNGAEETLIKRIIGLPGETVELRAGHVFINKRALDENYLKQTPDPDNQEPVVLAPGQYWVMGDNRNNSDDSRQNGPINDADIQGRAIWRLAPLGRLGRLPSAGYER